MDERHALHELKRHNETALAWFIERYAPYVNTIVFNITGGRLSDCDMEEMASDVFLVLWKNADRIRPGKAKAYLSAAARNIARDRLRRSGQDLPLEDNILAVSNMDMERELILREAAGLVRRAILKMRQPDREIFLRHYYYYQPLSQISEEMEINLSTVKTRLRRGRTRLTDELRKGGYDLDAENI